MASMRFVIDKFSAGSGLESFGSGPVCFDFGHCFVSLKYNSLMKIYHSFVKNQNKNETATIAFQIKILGVLSAGDDKKGLRLPKIIILKLSL